MDFPGETDDVVRDATTLYHRHCRRQISLSEGHVPHSWQDGHFVWSWCRGGQHGYCGTGWPKAERRVK